jgi:hypothetical protein
MAMATYAETLGDTGQARASGGPIARAVDRWIFVFMAAFFIAVTLAGFIPDSLMKIAAVKAGERPPFPLVLHMHAVLMGSFLLLLLAQATLMATGRHRLHRKLGLAAFVLAPAIVVVGFILVPTNYHTVWEASQAAPPPVRAKLNDLRLWLDNIMLLQLRIGFLFPIFLAIGIRARERNAGLHKRMMFLAVAMALPASFDRITWIPTTMPASPISPDLYTLLAVAPMFIWDLVRNRSIHKAYWIWIAVNIPFAIVVHSLWNTPWWHATAPRIMGI